MKSLVERYVRTYYERGLNNIYVEGEFVLSIVARNEGGNGSPSAVCPGWLDGDHLCIGSNKLLTRMRLTAVESASTRMRSLPEMNSPNLVVLVSARLFNAPLPLA